MRDSGTARARWTAVARLLAATTATLALLSTAAMAAITFDPLSYTVDVPSLRPDYIRVADFDRDGHPDFVVSEENGALHLYRNPGTPFGGAWTRTTIATFVAGPPDYMDFVDTGDLDGDGWTDIVAGVCGGAIQALRNDHTPFGPWASIQIATAAMSPRVELCDLDGDGWLDLATLDNQYSGDPGSLRIFRNDGTPFDAAWTTSLVVTGGYANSALDSGDLDNDGACDLAFGMNENYTYVAQNDGSPWDGGWSVQNIGFHGGGMSSGYVLADFNGDGFLDLAMACPYQPATPQYVLQNDGTPFDGWWPSVDYGTAVALGIVAGDLDLDGDLDLATGDDWNYPQQCMAWENDGVPFDGNWPGTAIGFGGQAPRALALGDLDGDGDLDVVQSHWAWPGPTPLLRLLRNLAIVPEPANLAVSDVPGDQGGRVLVEWGASGLDNSTIRRIGSYHVWRRLEGAPALSALGGGAVSFDGTLATAAPGAIRTLGIGTMLTYWEYLAEVPARYAEGYAYTAATHSDQHAEEFFVDAYDPAQGAWWLSEIVSGESVDNLAPAVPAPFVGAYQSGTTWLHWGPNRESDLKEYAIYRSASAGGPWTLVATSPDTGYGDAGPAGRWYRLTAFDVHGNESGSALLTPAGTVDAPRGGELGFALAGIRPNPARGDRLDVEFVLARTNPARLELLDVAGRRIVSREVGALGTGRHQVNLASGGRLAPGLYLVRLAQGADARVARVAIID